MKVKAEVLQKYNDLQLKRLIGKGEILILDKKRAEELIDKKLIQVIEIIREKRATKAVRKPKKSTKKNED